MLYFNCNGYILSYKLKVVHVGAVIAAKCTSVYRMSCSMLKGGLPVSMQGGERERERGRRGGGGGGGEGPGGEVDIQNIVNMVMCFHVVCMSCIPAKIRWCTYKQVLIGM